MSNDPLLQPFTLKHLVLRNRLLSTAHEPAYTEDGLPKERYRLYHAEKAKGGIGLTMIGGSAVVAPDSPQAFGNILLYKDEVRAVAAGARRRRACHGAAVMIQITHLGRRTSWSKADWLPILAPSNVREPAHRAFPKIMEDWDIARVVAAYADAAERVKAAGLDGIELECYGHLIDQFWSPATNHRDDAYGGSLDNRMRFGMEVLAAIRARVGPAFIVGARMVCDEDWSRGLSREEGVSIAERLTASGMIDFVNVIKGHIDTEEGLSHVIPGMGARSAPAARLCRRGPGRHAHADLPRGPHPGCRDRAPCHRERQARHGGHDASPSGRPAYRPQDRGRARTCDPALRRHGLLHRLDLFGPGGLHPQCRDGPGSHAAACRAAEPGPHAASWWSGPGPAGSKRPGWRASAATPSRCSRRRRSRRADPARGRLEAPPRDPRASSIGASPNASGMA